MTDLIAFLRAALDEDEARAQDYEREPHTVACGVRLGYWAEPDCICGYPARVLAEVAAKRAILDLHRFGRRTVYGKYSESGALVVGDVTYSCHLCRDFSDPRGTGACRTVRLLAQAYGWEGP